MLRVTWVRIVLVVFVILSALVIFRLHVAAASFDSVDDFRPTLQSSGERLR
jgi:hypothetical protein